METTPTQSDPFAIALADLVLENLDRGQLNKAFETATSLTGIDPFSGKTWWLFGISTDNDSDLSRAINKLCLLDPPHNLNEYNIPFFEANSSKDKSRKNTYQRNRYAVVLYISALALQSAVCIFAYIGLLSWRIAGVILLCILFWLVLFVIRNTLRSIFWTTMQKMMKKDWNSLKWKYWKIALLSSQLATPLRFSTNIRPEPYSTFDAQLLAELPHINHLMQATKKFHSRLLQISQVKVRGEVEEYLGTIDKGFRIRIAISVLNDIKIYKKHLNNALLQIVRISGDQPTLDDIHQLLQSMWHQSSKKSKDLVVLFCQEGSTTAYGMYDQLDSIYCCLTSLDIFEGHYYNTKPGNWKTAIKGYDAIYNNLTDIEKIAMEIQCITDNRNRANSLLNSAIEELNLLEIELKDPSIDVDISDLLSYIPIIAQQHHNLQTLKPSPEYYAKVLNECPKLIEDIETKMRLFHRRRELVRAIRMTASQVEGILNNISSDVLRVELEPNFTFDVTQERYRYGYGRLKQLRELEDYNDSLLLERLEGLNRLLADMQSAMHQFDKAKDKYAKVAAYERLDVLIETLINIAKKHKFLFKETKEVLRSAQKNIARIRKIALTHESKLENIVSLYNSTEQAFLESSNEIITAVKGKIEAEAKTILDAARTLKGWAFVDQFEFDKVNLQIRNINNVFKEIGNSSLDGLPLKLLDEKTDLFFETIQSNREYLEHLTVLSQQYAYTAWRVYSMRLPKNSHLLNQGAEETLNQVEQCVTTARSGRVFSAINATLLRADSILNQLSSELKYSPTFVGQFKGLVVGDNANVNMNYQGSGSLSKGQLFELGTHFANLCWKLGELSLRKKAFERIQDIIIATNTGALFPQDVLFNLVNDTIAPFIDTTKVINDGVQTRDRLSDNIRRNTDRVYAAWFLVGFNIMLSINIASLETRTQFRKILQRIVSDLRSAIVTLRFSTDIKTLDESIGWLLEEGHFNSITGILRQMQAHYAKRSFEASRSSRTK